jgi:MFS family permease
MMISARYWAAGLAGFVSFLNLYSPQAILPLLGQEFSASAAEISAIMAAGALAVALIAPFTGTVADVVGRKRVIVFAMTVIAVPTAMQALSPTLDGVIF